MSPDDFLGNREFELHGLPGPVDADTQRIDWRRIDPQWIERHYETLAFCYPLDFQLLLPAYMSYAVRHLNEQTNVPDFLVYALYPSSTRARKRKEMFLALTKDQCWIVCRFLSFLLESDQEYVLPELPKALTYWTQHYESLADG